VALQHVINKALSATKRNLFAIWENVVSMKINYPNHFVIPKLNIVIPKLNVRPIAIVHKALLASKEIVKVSLQNKHFVVLNLDAPLENLVLIPMVHREYAKLKPHAQQIKIVEQPLVLIQQI
jgi:hypothetical protein